MHLSKFASVGFRGLYKAALGPRRSVRRRSESQHVVSISRLARSESVRGSAGASTGRPPAGSEAGQGTVTSRLSAAAVALLQHLQRAGRGARRGPRTSKAQRRRIGHSVLRRACAIQPGPQRRLPRAAGGALAGPPSPQASPTLLPVQELRLQVPVLLLRAQTPQALSRGRTQHYAGVTTVPGAVHLQRLVGPPGRKVPHETDS